jgi:hypothetical protein
MVPPYLSLSFNAMKNMTSLSRRTFGGLVGASALSATVAFPAMAATPADDTILQLRSVPLAWPQYHRLDAAAQAPRLGEAVSLVREGPQEVEAEAIAVVTADGQRLGVIPRRHNAALFWAMQRGEVSEARIAKVATPVVRGKPVPGWGAYHIDVTVGRAALA